MSRKMNILRTQIDEFMADKLKGEIEAISDPKTDFLKNTTLSRIEKARHLAAFINRQKEGNYLGPQSNTYTPTDIIMTQQHNHFPTVYQKSRGRKGFAHNDVDLMREAVSNYRNRVNIFNVIPANSRKDEKIQEIFS